MSSCILVSLSRNKSIAHPPATNQGNPNLSIMFFTFMHCSNITSPIRKQNKPKRHDQSLVSFYPARSVNLTYASPATRAWRAICKDLDLADCVTSRGVRWKRLLGKFSFSPQHQVMRRSLHREFYTRNTEEPLGMRTLVCDSWRIGICLLILLFFFSLRALPAALRRLFPRATILELPYIADYPIQNSKLP